VSESLQVCPKLTLAWAALSCPWALTAKTSALEGKIIFRDELNLAKLLPTKYVHNFIKIYDT